MTTTPCPRVDPRGARRPARRRPPRRRPDRLRPHHGCPARRPRQPDAGRASGHRGPVVVSIFVNPMQFGPTEDLDRYPRTLEADLEVCAAEGVDVVFAPSVEEMYPGGFSHDSVHDGVTVAPGTLATILDGASRPGHFDGVLTVVAKLFGLVRPDVAVFGQKDYQQLVLIRRMVRDLCMGIEVRGRRDGPRARRPGPLQPQPLPRRRPAGGRGRPQPGAARRAGAGGVRRTCRALGRDVGPQGRGRPRARLPRAHLHRPRRAATRRRGPDPGGCAGRHHAADRQHAASCSTASSPMRAWRGPRPRPRPPLEGAADAAHDDEVQDPPGHGDPGRPPLRRVGHRRRGPARRRRPAGGRARPHRRRHQRRPARDLHDRRRARLGRHRHQRCRRPAGAPRRHGHPHRLRPDGRPPRPGSSSRTSCSSTPTTRSWPPASTPPRPSATSRCPAATSSLDSLRG